MTGARSCCRAWLGLGLGLGLGLRLGLGCSQLLPRLGTGRRVGGQRCEALQRRGKLRQCPSAPHQRPPRGKLRECASRAAAAAACT